MAKADQDRPLRVALTGARTFLGSQLIERLERDPRCTRIVALDIAPPRVAGHKVVFKPLDLTHPSADERAARLLATQRVDVLVHLAFLSRPKHNQAWAHELEAIGSLYAMNAAAQAEVCKFILGSTTMVYGAWPDNPNYLTEDHRLRGNPSSRWVRDRVAAERELAKLARECPDMVTTSLRFGNTLGPNIVGFFPRFFKRQALLWSAGYDPLMQFLHEDDAVDALVTAVFGDYRGAYNIVGDGVLYYSQLRRIGGRPGFALPYGLAEAATEALFALQLVDTPGTFLRFFRYSWAADGAKAAEVMGFRPRWSSRQTVEIFYGLTPSRSPAAGAGAEVS